MEHTCAACGKQWPSDESGGGTCPHCRTHVDITRLVRGSVSSPRSTPPPDSLTASSLADMPSELEAALADPNNRFGKYVRVRLLGKGGMGEVWKAWDVDLRRWAALKFPASDDREYLDRLKREARAAAKLSHPNVAQVYEYGSSEGRHFIAMQFVDGRTLTGVSKEDRRSLIELLRSAALGVAHAHAQGIIHRDLKPDNIMVDRSGRAFVMDFGIARETAGQNMTTGVMGTPAFMSPEQAQGRPTDARSDVWSLGVCLHNILSGEVPFDGATPVDVMHRVVHDDPVPLRGVASDLSTIVHKCLQKEPARRYATAQEFADDLGRYLSGDAISARPPRLTYQMSRYVARHRAKAVVVAVLLVVVVLAVTVVAPALRQKDTKIEAMEAELDRQRELQAYEDLIQDARRFFYIPGNDFKERWERVRESLVTMEALAKQPKWISDGRIHGTLGIGWYFVGEEDRAEAALREALRLNPQDARASYYLGRLLLIRALQHRRAGRDHDREKELAAFRKLTEDAVDFLKRTEEWKEVSEIDRQIATAYRTLARQETDALEELCRKGLQTFGDLMGTEEFWVLLGESKRGTEAIECFDRALERRPHFAWAYYARAIAKEGLGQLAEAGADYTQALRVVPGFVQALSNRGTVRARLNDSQGALDDFNELLRLQPRSPSAHNNRGMVRAGINDVKGAMEDYTKAIELDSDYASAYNNRARLLLEQGHPEEGLRDLETAVRLRSRSAEYRRHLAINLWMLKRTEEALKTIKAAIDIDPSYAPAHQTLGRFCAEQGEYTDALESFSEAVRLNPKDWMSLTGRGKIRYELGLGAGAMEDIELSLELNPRQAGALLVRGNHYMDHQRVEDAIEEYTRAIEIDPGFASAYYNRANAQRDLLRYEEALEDYEDAIRLNSELSFSYLNRALVLIELGRTEEALPDLDHYVAAEPADPDGFRGRGEARSRLEQWADAEADLSHALRIAPEGWTHRAATGELLKKVRSALGDPY